MVKRSVAAVCIASLTLIPAATGHTAGTRPISLTSARATVEWFGRLEVRIGDAAEYDIGRCWRNAAGPWCTLSENGYTLNGDVGTLKSSAHIFRRHGHLCVGGPLIRDTCRH